MVYGRKNTCLKYLSFTCNIIILVIGAGILALSLTARYSHNAQNQMKNAAESSKAGITVEQIHLFLYILAALGGVLFLTGILGCFGSFFEKGFLLVIVFTIILLLFIGKLACGIVILVNGMQFKTKLEDELTKQMNDYSDLNADDRDEIDRTQKELQCCGCKGPEDYPSNKPKPHSCFVDKHHRDIYEDGCCAKIVGLATGNIVVVGGVAIGILVVELLAMIFNCWFWKTSRHGDYEVAG